MTRASERPPRQDPGGAEDDRVRALAERLDCLTENDLALLADVAASTLESWRKRGDGPGTVRFGNRFLYPRQAVSDWLMTRLRERKPHMPGGLL